MHYVELEDIAEFILDADTLRHKTDGVCTSVSTSTCITHPTHRFWNLVNSKHVREIQISGDDLA